MNTVDKMDIIWKDVLSPYAVEMHDEQIDLLFDLEKVLVDKADKLEARVKELEQELSSARFLIHAEQVAREDLDRRLSTLVILMWDEQIPGLKDRLNDLEKKA